MNQIDFAKDYFNEAKIRLETAKNVISKETYAFCVRLCQEAVELSLKAALRLVGIDFPKWHDIGEVLIKEKEKFPNEFQNKIEKLTEISKFLVKFRELAMYGDELSSKSPSMIFNEEIAKNALIDTKFCVDNIENLFDVLLKKLNG